MNKKIVLFGFFVVISSLVIGIGIGNMLINKDNNTNINNNENSNTNINNNDYELSNKNDNEWIQYLLNQNIKESYIRVWGVDDDRDILISKGDLRNIFNEMNKFKMEKSYYSGGGDTTPDIVIKYVTNKKNYEMIISMGKFILYGGEWDFELAKLLDKRADKINEKENLGDIYFQYEFKWNSENYLNLYIKD